MLIVAAGAAERVSGLEQGFISTGLCVAPGGVGVVGQGV